MGVLTLTLQDSQLLLTCEAPEFLDETQTSDVRSQNRDVKQMLH